MSKIEKQYVARINQRQLDLIRAGLSNIKFPCEGLLDLMFLLDQAAGTEETLESKVSKKGITIKN